jgi:hypothetical protein
MTLLNQYFRRVFLLVVINVVEVLPSFRKFFKQINS